MIARLKPETSGVSHRAEGSFHRGEGGRRDGAAEACGEQPVANAVDARFRMDSQDELREPVDRGLEDAVAERLLALPESGAKLAVGGRPLHRNLTVAGGRR